MPGTTTTFARDQLKTPIGTALLVTDADGVLCALDWEDYEARMTELLRRQHGAVALKDGRAPQAMRLALSAYFDGDLASLDTIKWRVAGTPFQQKVWTALPGIKAGTTMSYGALAARLKMPKAVRAVGHANGANPISVVVPCHRLIGADGSLVKYGGGLSRKRWLLAHEGVAFKGSSADLTGEDSSSVIARSQRVRAKRGPMTGSATKQSRDRA
jgi:methylated-DNA-[protein]-cysteine S-methyltransferase